MFTENNTINSLKDLIQSLRDDAKYKSYADVLKNIRFGFGEVEHLCFWDPDNYSKITIDKNGEYELALICWEKNQESTIHNHPNEEAWTYVLKGELTEDVFEEGGISNSKVLKRRRMSALIENPTKQHKLTNSFLGRSVSLHLYKH